MRCRKTLVGGNNMNIKSTHTKTSSILVFFMYIFLTIMYISRSEYLPAGIFLLLSILMFSYYLELKTEKTLNKYHKNARDILYYIVIILVIIYLIYLYSLLV